MTAAAGAGAKIVEGFLQRGLADHQAGRIDDAEAMYRQVLILMPGNADALHFLGIAAWQRGRRDEALGLYHQALLQRPNFPAALNNFAVALSDAGRLDDARAAAERAVSLAPDFVEARNTLGNVRLARGDAAGAAEAFRAALALRPEMAEAHANLGNALQRLGMHEEAVEAYRAAIARREAYPEAHNNLGNALAALRQPAAAEAAYRRAIALRPDYADAHNHLGTLLGSLGRHAEALEAYRATVALRPDSAAAYNNLGNALQDLGRLEEAVAAYQEAVRRAPRMAMAHANLGNAWRGLARFDEAVAALHQAVTLDPQSAIAHSNLGVALKEKELLPEAEAALRRAIALDPDFAAAYNNLAHVQQDRGFPDEATAALDAAIARDPANAGGLLVKRALTLPVIMESHDAIAATRARVERAVDELLAADVRVDDPVSRIAGCPFYLAYHGANDRPLQQKLARLALHACPSLAYVAPPPPARERIRLGVFSVVLRDHTIGRLYQGLIEKLPRDRLEVVLFRPPGREDAVSRAIDAGADRVVRVGGRLETLRAQIAAEAPDALLYTDIGMDALSYYLAFARLAPVQCVTWGHPVTTGIPAIDYFLSSEDLEPPGADDHYSERLIRFRQPVGYYYRPDATAAPFDRVTAGLPADARLYACPQTLFKFHPDFDAAIAGILRGDPQGHFVLLHGKDPHWDALLTARFERTMPDVAGRIRFVKPMPRAGFVGFLAAADVLLDPFPFGGGNSTYEAFSVGTPVVTLPGSFMRGRVTHALYRQMGIADCTARDTDDYVRIALRLGRDPGERSRVAALIRDRAGALFETAPPVRDLARFMVAAVEAARRGERLDAPPP
ncbi:MAG: tetratricopeptide repeat protein [Rhodospirillales bacterium]